MLPEKEDQAFLLYAKSVHVRCQMVEAALALLSGLPYTAKRCCVDFEPRRRKATDALRPHALALVNKGFLAVLKVLPLAKLARLQLKATTKIAAARNLGVWALLGFLWEALVKAPKALLMSTAEAAVTPEKEDQALLLSAEPAPEPAPSLRRACAEPDSSPEHVPSLALRPSLRPCPSLRRA